MGNGRRFEARKQRLFPRPLPIIGVRRVIMQCRAHDDDRAAPAVAPGPEIPMASAFQPAPPEQGCFFRGLGYRWIRGTPGPKPLCHRHPTGPHPSGLLWTPAKGDSTKSNFALAPGALQRLVGLPLLDARDVVAGEGLRVLARIALDPGEHQALRLAVAALLGLEQHLGSSPRRPPWRRRSRRPPA